MPNIFSMFEAIQAVISCRWMLIPPSNSSKKGNMKIMYPTGRAEKTSTLFPPSSRAMPRIVTMSDIPSRDHVPVNRPARYPSPPRTDNAVPDNGAGNTERLEISCRLIQKM